jgi:hypothetical protein
MRAMRPQEWNGLVLLAAGIGLVVATVGGYTLGQAADTHWGTAPRWALIGLTVGFALGLWELVALALWAMRTQPPPPPPLPEETHDEES